VSFIRPEIAAALHRWREAIAGLAVAVPGVWLATLGGWFFQGLGLGVVLVGLGIAWASVRRRRFEPSGQAPGVVQMVEGQIAYFGPETGGFVALTEVEELRLEPGPQGAVWVLVQPQGTVAIPADASGAGLLWDFFAALPGIDMAALQAALVHPARHARVLWRRKALPALR
jgi:hypothetical protein